jgi:folylpolyglutamate synthase/dihydropteroate synthase
LLENSLRENRPHAVGIQHDSVQSALAAALEAAGENDKIVVFGSFLTVGEVIAWLKRRTSRH